MRPGVREKAAIMAGRRSLVQRSNAWYRRLAAGGSLLLLAVYLSWNCNTPRVYLRSAQDAWKSSRLTCHRVCGQASRVAVRCWPRKVAHHESERGSWVRQLGRGYGLVRCSGYLYRGRLKCSLGL